MLLVPLLGPEGGTDPLGSMLRNRGPYLDRSLFGSATANSMGSKLIMGWPILHGREESLSNLAEEDWLMMRKMKRVAVRQSMLGLAIGDQNGSFLVVVERELGGDAAFSARNWYEREVMEIRWGLVGLYM